MTCIYLQYFRQPENQVEVYKVQRTAIFVVNNKLKLQGAAHRNIYYVLASQV